MSSMDGSSDKPTFHRLQSEQEREKRRMRDRQRRRSMTSEQKERHLARRRKNYQLRMKRVKHRELVIQPGSMNTSLESGINCLNHQQAGVYDPKPALQFSYVAPGKEPLAYDLSKLRRRLRLIHVKHFARSLKRTLGELAVNNVPILTDLITKGNRVSSCKSAHGIRLNRIKQLARGQKSTPIETSKPLHISEAEGNLEKQILMPVEGYQPRPADESRLEAMVT